MLFRYFLSLGYLSESSLYFLLLSHVGLILQFIQSMNSFCLDVIFLLSHCEHYLMFFQPICFIKIYYEGLLAWALTHYLTSVLLVSLLALDHSTRIKMLSLMSSPSFAYFTKLSFFIHLLSNSVTTFNKLIYVCFHLTSLSNESYSPKTSN